MDGVANSASTLTATGANGTSLQTITIASAAFTYTVWLKRKTGTGNIDITDNNGTNWTTVTGLSSAVFTPYSITRTQANPIVGIRVVTSGDEVEVDGCQLENGGYRTSVIATTTVAVTRALDSVIISNLSWFIQGAACTLYSHAETILGSDFTGGVVSINDTTASNRIEITVVSKDDQYININTGGSEVAAWTQTNSINVNVYASGAAVKTASAFTTNDARPAVNGVLGSPPDTNLTIASTMTELRIGNDAINRRFYGFVKEIRYYNTRKPDSFLIEETI